MDTKENNSSLFKHLLTLPNVLTVIRISASVWMLFLSPLSTLFYVIYSVGGISDLFDGMTARLLKKETELGARLDSVADLLFYAVMIYKIFPVLWENLPKWLWLLIAAVIAVRIGSYLVAAWKYRRFASMHTYANKLTGLFVFLVPYFLSYPFHVTYCFAVTLLGGLSSSEELFLHILRSEYDPKEKGFLFHWLCKPTKNNKTA